MVLGSGGALVSVAVAEHQVDQVVALMGRATAEDLAVRAVPW